MSGTLCKALRALFVDKRYINALFNLICRDKKTKNKFKSNETLITELKRTNSKLDKIIFTCAALRFYTKFHQ